MLFVIAFYFLLVDPAFCSISRYQLNCKKHKVDEYSRRPRSYAQQSLMLCLSKLSNNEDFKDEDKALSKSILGGSMNTCKTRVLNFVRVERVMQGLFSVLTRYLAIGIFLCLIYSDSCIFSGTVSSYVPRIRTRLVMTEKPIDGTVAWYQGDIDDGDVFPAEDHLLALPNTVSLLGI